MCGHQRQPLPWTPGAALVATAAGSGALRGHGCLVAAQAAGRSAVVKTAAAEAQEDEDMQEEWVEIGRIGPPHGVRGEMKVQPLTDFPEDRLGEPGPRWVHGFTVGRMQICHCESGYLVHGLPCPAFSLLFCWCQHHVSAVELRSLLPGAFFALRRCCKHLSLRRVMPCWRVPSSRTHGPFPPPWLQVAAGAGAQDRAAQGATPGGGGAGVGAQHDQQGQRGGAPLHAARRGDTVLLPSAPSPPSARRLPRWSQDKPQPQPRTALTHGIARATRPRRCGW